MWTGWDESDSDPTAKYSLSMMRSLSQLAATKGALYPNSCHCPHQPHSLRQLFEIQYHKAHPTLQQQSMTSTFDRRHCCLLSGGWQMGNRGSSVCVCLCVGGTVGGGTSELLRLILSPHADNGMLSHIPDGLWERECVSAGRQESGCFRGWLTHGCTEGGTLSRQIVLPSALPLSTMMRSIYLIRASSLLSGCWLISAGTQKRRQCHRWVGQELMNL